MGTSVALELGVVDFVPGQVDATTRSWTPADQLRIGDHLQTSNGGVVTIRSLYDYTTRMVTYNLTIDNLHTYYVLAGIAPILVHNTSGPYACDIQASEGSGGHIIARHVGKDDAFLRSRNIPNASTYTDLSAATRETQANLDAHTGGIQSWLSGGSPQLSIRSPIVDPADARVLNKASGGEVPGAIVVTILRRDANMPDGFRIHTSYVDP